MNLEANNRLVFLAGCHYAFDLEKLLSASAEVLGKGTYGTAYKATLEDGTTVVVKRLKDVIAVKRDFVLLMEIACSIKHENVVDLKAYYYSKDEKMMIYDFFGEGSVWDMLHEKRGSEKTPLDWDSRLRIAVGAARGIARIHTQNGGKLVHGNVKSSNIFLNSQKYGCVSDLKLEYLTSSLSPPTSRAFGYRAPEMIDTYKATQASDVFSFGVVLLELLTGKSPIQAKEREKIVHLIGWVGSIAREDWTVEVFDVELMRYPNIEKEMVEMLHIALSCVATLPDQRPKMVEIVKMIEKVRPMEAENWPSSTNRSESSMAPQAVETKSSTPQ